MSLRPYAPAASLALLAALAACDVKVESVNAYDPASSDPAPASVSGKVLAPGLSQDADVPVRLRSLRDPAEATERITDAGSGEERPFRFDSVKPGQWALEVSITGYDPVTRLLEVGIGEDLDVGLVTLVPQVGDRGGALHGVVTLEGRPDGGHADVVVDLDGGAETRITDGTGAFRMEGVRPGAHLLQLRHPDFLSLDAPLEVVVEAGGDLDVNDGGARPLVLRANPGTIRGTVLVEDAFGQLVPSAGVEVAVEGGAGSVQTDAEGAFSLPDVVPGDRVLVASAPGHVPGRVAVVLRGGQTVALPDPIDLRYEKGSLSGTVRLTDRNAGEFDLLTVELRGPDDLALAALPRDSVELRSGGYGFVGLPVGTYRIVARHDEYGVGEAEVVVAAGAETAVPELELSRLQGDFAIDGGAPYTNDPEGDVVLRFQLPANASELRVSQDVTVFDGDLGWQPVPPDGIVPFAIELLDGEQTIFAQIRDSDGAVGRLLQSSIVRDTSGPLPSQAPPAVVVGSGGGFAREADGTLTISLLAADPPAGGALVSSGVGRVEVWIDVAAVPDTSNLASSPYVTSPLVVQRVAPDPLSDGERLVHAVFFDRAGNASPEVAVPVVLDRVAPQGSIHVVASDAADSFVRDTRVRVEIAGTDLNGPLEVRLANTSALGQAPFVPADAVIEHTLPFGDGPKTVFAELRDAAGNLSAQLSDDVTLDTSAPIAQGLLVAAGAQAVALRDVDVHALGSGAVEMELSVVSPSGAVQSLVVPFPDGQVTLADEEGEHRVTAVLVDAAGNRSSAVTDTVALDVTPPAGGAVSIEEGAFVPAPAVTLALAAQGASRMRVAADGLVDTEPEQPFAGSLAVVLPGADGAKTVEVVFLDEAGNASPPAQATTTLDRAFPTPGPTPLAVLVPPPFTAASTTAVNLRFDAAGADELRYAAAATPAGGAWVPYTTDGLVLLPAPDGTKDVSVEFRDRAGNTIGPFAVQVELDTAPPNAQGLVLAGGAEATRQLLVDVEAVGTGATTMELSVLAPSGALQTITAAVPTTQVTLAAEEGSHRVTATLLDDAGNRAAAISETIDYDVTAPASGSVSILDGAAVRSRNVSLSLFALGATRMRVAVDGVVDTEPLQPYATSLGVALPAGDGPKTVAVVFADAAGNESAAVTAATTLDTAAPVPGGTPLSVVLPAPYTQARDTAVNLAFSATGATEMRYATGASPASAPWVPYAATGVVFLPATDGAYTVSVELRDDAGNVVGPFTASVTLDTAPPTSPQLTLPGQTPYTTSRTLTPTLTATGASFMKIGTDASLSGAALLPYAAGAYNGLAALGADGVATVYAQFVDAAGNATGILSVSTTVDTVAPEAPSLRLASASPTSSTTVAVEPFATGAAEMSFVVDGVAGAFVPYAQSANVSIGAAQGAHTVAVQFRDAAGNTTPAAARPSVTVTLDTTAPTPGGTPIQVVLDAPFTEARTSSVSLTFSATGADEMRFAAASTPTGAAWVPYAASGVLLLPAPDGDKTVSVEFRDLAGNVVGPFTASVTLDTAAPTGPSVSLGAQAPYSTTRSLTPTLSATGASFMKVSHDPGFAGASLVAYAGGVYNGLPALAADGPASVYAQFWDAAGNATPVVSASTTVDTLVPQDEALTLVTASPTSASTVTVAPFATGATQMRFFVDGTPGSLQPYADTASVAIPAADGAHTVAVEFRDAAGNATPAASRRSVTVVRDTAAPTAPALTLRGYIGYYCDYPGDLDCEPAANPDTATYTRFDAVELTATATGATGWAFGSGVLDCASASYEALPLPTALRRVGAGLGEGANTVTLCFRDDAGNTSFATGSITLDTTPPAPGRVLSVEPSHREVSWTWGPSPTVEPGLVYRAIERGTSGGIEFVNDTVVGPSGSRDVTADNCTEVGVMVRVHDVAGNAAEANESSATPRFAAPEDVAVVGWHRTMVATWDPVPDAHHYELELVGANDRVLASGLTANATTTRISTLDAGSDLGDGSAYYVRVRGTDAAGSCDGDVGASEADSTLLPSEIQSRFGGRFLAGGGDFDLDGFGDWINVTRQNVGNVMSGRTGESLLIVGPRGRSSGAGTNMIFASDLDDDGDVDVVIADPELDEPAATGRVTAHSGRDGAEIWSVTGVAGEQFGAALLAPGDLTGDGVGDIVVGAPSGNGGAGRILVLNGATGAAVGVGINGASVPAGSQDFGMALASTTFPTASCGAGAVAPCTVILVASPTGTSMAGGRLAAGTATVFRANVVANPTFTSLAATRQWSGALANANLGTAVAFVPDANGDGTPDVVLGAPGQGAGRIEVYSGATGASLRNITDPAGTAAARLGSSLATSEDLDGDGGGEILAGAPGQSMLCMLTNVFSAGGKAVMVSASRGDLLWARSGDPCDFGSAPTALGTGVAFADVDADGAPNWVVGAPGADRPFINDAGVTSVWNGGDLGLFPGSLRSFKLFEHVLSGTGGTPPYTFAFAAGSPASSGTITAEGLYRAGGLVATDYVTVTDAKSRTRTVPIGVFDFSELTSFTPVFAEPISTVAVIGDVTGPGGIPDGIREIAVSSSFEPGNGWQDAGVVRVYNGSTYAQVWAYTGTLMNNGVGSGFLPLPDLTGDGKPELIVAGWHPVGDAVSHFGNAGNLQLHNGATGALIGSQVNGASGERLGWALAAAPTATRPGRFVATAPWRSTDNGGIYVCEATAAALTCTVRHTSSGVDGQLGTSLAVGDLTGDGVDEVVVGAPNLSVDGGRIEIFGLDPDTDQMTRRLTTNPTGGADRFGSAVAIGSDYDFDGRPDILVGAELRIALFGPGDIVYVSSASGLELGSAGEVPGAGEGLKTFDADFDGRLDIYGSGGGDLFLMSGQTLDAFGRISTGDEFYDIGDLDLDGVADVVAADNNDVHVYRSQVP